MYTALQRIALTQAVGFECLKNPVLLLPVLVASRAPLRHLAHWRCWRASLELSVLGCSRRRPLVLVRDLLLLQLVGWSWDQGMVATGVAGGVIVSGGSYEQYAPFCRN